MTTKNCEYSLLYTTITIRLPSKLKISIFQYDKLAKLLKDFEPFKNLWLTVSDWIKWYESWMEDPLTSIDPESLEANVSNSFKILHKCYKAFKGNKT